MSATWGADAHSASSPEGLVRLAPLEIAPLPQQMPSGIVRSQVRHSLIFIVKWEKHKQRCGVRPAFSCLCEVANVRM